MNVHSRTKIAACDCDAPDFLDGILNVDEAVSIALSLVAPVRDTEIITLRKAVGRIAAHDLRAPEAMPFFDHSAMDGFAIRCADVAGEGPWHLPVSGTNAAGDGLSFEEICGGVARRIYTGAPLPVGADTVVMIEDCEDLGDSVAIHRLPRSGANIRRRGSDLDRGAVLVTAGTRIEPRHVGLLAASGYGALNVFRRPRVGVFSTGSELLRDGKRAGAAIYDANRPMLVALAEGAGAEVADLDIVPDDKSATARFFDCHAREFDLLISSGAVSVGGRDFIAPAFRAVGGAIHAWKVAMKPGKPVLFGTIGKTAFLGLPGNPLAAFVGFQLFGRGQVLRLGGAECADRPAAKAVAGFACVRKIGRREFVPVRIADRSAEGVPVVERLGNGSSGTLYPLCLADGLLVIPEDVAEVHPGHGFDFLPVPHAGC